MSGFVNLDWATSDSHITYYITDEVDISCNVTNDYKALT